jgi:hypothetical protein
VFRIAMLAVPWLPHSFSVRREHFDHVQVNYFAGFWIRFCRNLIRVSASDVTLLLIFLNPAMEIVGVPLAGYDWVIHVTSGSRHRYHTKQRSLPLGSWGLPISRSEPIPSSLNLGKLDAVSATP